MGFRVVLLAVALLPAGFGQTATLRAGVPRPFSIAAQAQPLVVSGITVAVPGGATRLTIDLEPDVPSNDLSLFARFDHDVAVSGGAVVAADFSSQTPGTGREQIVVTANSSPPLQTGAYYVAIAVVTLHTAITGTITATVDGGGSAGTFIISTFDFDTDGWTRNFGFPPPPSALSQGNAGSVLNWNSSGGAPAGSGGYLSLLSTGGTQQDFVVAPPKFLGNWAAMSNQRLEFDYWHNSGPDALFPLKVRVAGNGAVYEWTSAGPPANVWTHYRIALTADNWKRTAGTASLALALSNVDRFEISMEQVLGSQSNGLDNFAVVGDMPAAPPRTTPAVPVTSSFDGDTEGWGRNYPPVGVSGATAGDSGSALSWASDAGNPRGAIIYSEAGGGAPDFFVAPPKFLGNLAAIQNPQLEFDYKHTAQPQGVVGVVVRLLGAGAVYRWSGAFPVSQYQHYKIPLASAFFVLESGTAGFNEALAAVERLEIGADQSPADETDTLDNVVLLSASAGPLTPTLLVSPGPLAFNGAAGDPNPLAQTLIITSSADPANFGPGVAWTASVSPPVSWLSLSAAGGATPFRLGVTVSLVNLAPGNYATTIAIAAPGANNTPQAVPVTLTVTPAVAPAPRITAGSAGNAATFRGPVAPGSLATIFGDNLGPAGGVSAGFVPGTQTLPTWLSGVRLLVRNLSGNLSWEAPLLYTSNRQINFQMPFETAGLSSVLLVVDSNGTLSAPEPVVLAPVAPGLFTQPGTRAAAQNQDFTLNSPGNPTPRGGVLIAYLTGQGGLRFQPPSGQAAPLNPLAEATASATATIGDVPATVLFLGLTPGLVGVAQANIAVPAAAPVGEQTLIISIGGVPTNGALVSIR